MRDLIAVIQDGREYFGEVDDGDDAIDDFAAEAVRSFNIKNATQVMVKIYRKDRRFVKYVVVRQSTELLTHQEFIASCKKASKK